MRILAARELKFFIHWWKHFRELLVLEYRRTLLLVCVETMTMLYAYNAERTPGVTQSAKIILCYLPHMQGSQCPTFQGGAFTPSLIFEGVLSHPDTKKVSL